MSLSWVGKVVVRRSGCCSCLYNPRFKVAESGQTDDMRMPRGKRARYVLEGEAR